MSSRQRGDDMTARGIRVVLVLVLLFAGIAVGLFLGIRPSPQPETAEPVSSEPAPEAEATNAEQRSGEAPERETIRPADDGTGTSVESPPPDSAPLRGLL